jgi:glycosyltransferase involved in cell wall biosynthesis
LALPIEGPRVGVVTPFYNTREHLAECIESVLAQTYQNWEYVLVNNYSTDGSEEIAQQYAQRFPKKIRVIQPESFLDQVPNYNFGLRSVSSANKYSKMVQADDWIYPECLEHMVALAESDPKIAIVSSYRLKGKRVLGEGLPYTKFVLEGPEICRLQLRTGIFAFGTPTTMLYRSAIISKTEPFFDENSFYDDTDSCYRILHDGKFGFVHRVLSFSRVDDESIRGQVKDFNPDILDRLLQLSKFGPVYLEPREMEAFLREWERKYYGFLARNWLSGQGKEFWDYHREGLKSGGLRLDKSWLAAHVCTEALRMAVNPGHTVSWLYQKLTGRKNGQAPASHP